MRLLALDDEGEVEPGGDPSANSSMVEAVCGTGAKINLEASNAGWGRPGGWSPPHTAKAKESHTATYMTRSTTMMPTRIAA